MRRRWGQRKLSDAAIREIRALVQNLPRCEKTDREVGARFHVGHAVVRRIALGWMTPRGANRLLESRSQE
jgi:hypothetical protein